MTIETKQNQSTCRRFYRSGKRRWLPFHNRGIIFQLSSRQPAVVNPSGRFHRSV